MQRACACCVSRLPTGPLASPPLTLHQRPKTVLAACSQPPPHDYVAADGEAFPRVLYADGDVSRNDRCPVRKNKLNRHMDPLFVNGEPVGFC